MRIGIDLTSMWRPATGAEVVALGMTQALLRIDRENEYVLFFSREVHHELQEFAGQFKAVLAPQSHELFVKHLWLHRSVAAAKIDYMHFPAFPPPWHLTCPMGWTLPDATPWLYPKTMKLKSRWYYRIMGGRAFRTNRMLITDTQASREDLIRHVKIRPEQVHVICPGPRPIFRRYHNLDEFARVRQLYGLPENFILFVGTLEPRKNLARILSAFRLLKTQRDFEPALVIVGRKGWMYGPIFEELRNLGLAHQVHVTGYVADADLLALYNMARLLAFPSLYEGFGLPCVEAMACGCPVVTSNRGALLEVTEDCAVHCDPEDVAEIAEGIWRAETDHILREELVAKGFLRVASFSWDRYAKQFLEILERVVGGGKSEYVPKLCPAGPAR